MGLKYKKKELSALLTVFLSVILCCPLPAEAIISPDFSYIQISESKPIKLVNPIYLNKPISSETPVETVSPAPPVVQPPPELPKNKANDFFAPPVEIKSIEKPAVNVFALPQEPAETPVVQELKKIETEPLESIKDINDTEPVLETIPADIPQAGSITTEEKIFDIQEETLSPEGCPIGRIEINGLKTLNPDSILSNIKTRTGSYFNEELVQSDLQRIYAMGYFTDEMAVEPILQPDDTVDLIFVLKENLPVTETFVLGNTVISNSEIMEFIAPLKGLPQNIVLINQAIDNINNYYHSKGYILAKVNDVIDDEDGKLTFLISEGVIDRIEIAGNLKTKDFVIERNIMTQPGTVYNENYLKEDLSRIYSTQIFSDVTREIEPSETGKGEYLVKVVVTEQSTNSVGLGGGIDTGLGLFGSVSYKEDNFLGRGQKLSLSGILGSGILLSDASIKNRMNYQLELNFFEPYFLNADNSLMGKLYYRDMGSYQIPLAIERRFGLTAGVEHKVRGYNNLTTSFSAGFENISLSEGDFAKISSLYAQRNLNIANRAKQLTGGFFINLAPGIKYSTLDADENPRNGVIAQAKFMEAISLSDINHTNGRLAGSVTKYFPVRKKSSFSLTARGGIKVHGDDMPEVMAFRLGGPYSVRGYRINGVGTGDAFISGSAELATPLPFVDRLKFDFLQKIRLTFFVDAGRIFDPTLSSTLYDRPLNAIAAGVGIKVFIPGVGPISVDYGIPLINPGDFGSKNGYFTFGTSGMYGCNY